jgi:DNA-3-methyladenine glycosylase II
MLSFHRRDAQEIAEQVSPGRIRKGLIWQGLPSCLTLHFTERSVAAELAIDGVVADAEPLALESMVRRMLGLAQPIEAFELAYHDHPLLAPLLSRQSGLRVPATASPFEALTWAVTGQQISVSAAVSVRRKLILATDARHSSGLYCHPDAARLAAFSVDDLRRAGFSASKASTLSELARQVRENALPLDDWLSETPAEALRAQLLRIKGIGPWTVNYTLLRGFGWLDGSLHGDVAVRRALQLLLQSVQKVDEAQAQAWLSAFSPWRALVAAHLWAMLSTVAY